MVEAELKRLTKMLVTLSYMGIVVLDPPPPPSWEAAVKPGGTVVSEQPEDDEDDATEESAEDTEPVHTKPPGVAELKARLKLGDLSDVLKTTGTAKAPPPQPPPYDPITATPTPRLKQMMIFRAVHPLYGLFLMDYLGKSDDAELIQILESLLEIPGSVAKSLRVPWPDDMPPGKLAVEIVDPDVLTTGLATADDLYPPRDQSDVEPTLRKYPIPLATKLKMLFENTIDHAGGLFVTPVWAVGDLLDRGGNFDQFVRTRELTKQEGIVFKHVLRMILLCGEFAQLTPKDADPTTWRTKLTAIAETLTTACRAVDPQSTDETLEEMTPTS